VGVLLLEVIMAVTLEDLEKRLKALEDEVNVLRKSIENPDGEEASKLRGAWVLRETRRSQAELAAGFARALEAMGIHGEPIGAENVQKMIAACGVDPEGNEFSRGIIEMREE
jgi:hypothetical protein